MKKLIYALACCAVMALTVCSCSGHDDVYDNEKTQVALILPSGTTVSRWADDAQYLTNSLNAYDYEVKLYTAKEDEEGAAQQVAQLKEVLDNGIKNIIITPIDYNKINESGLLESHQDCNFVCYDRMIMNNPAVDFYISCDPKKIGEMQAQFLVQKVDYRIYSPSNKRTIEYFAGPKTDKNAVNYFNGAFNILNASQLFEVPSGKKTYDEVALDSWSSPDAKAAMLARYEETGVLPDMILAPNDNVANGIIEAIEEIVGPKIVGFRYPFITGQDMTEQAIANIKARKQAMTIYKEYENLAETAAIVVCGFITGHPVITTQTFNNGSKEVPAKFTSFTLITEFNSISE